MKQKRIRKYLKIVVSEDGIWLTGKNFIINMAGIREQQTGIVKKNLDAAIKGLSNEYYEGSEK